MTEIYLNGELADFEEEETIVSSYGNISFGEFSKKKGVKTNTYKLPLTNRNKLIIENAEIVNNASTLPYRFFNIVIFVYGIEVFSGYAAIRSAKDSYEVQSFAGVSTFYNTISKKKITELDLSDFNHTYDLASIQSSWNNTDGYIYGYVWYGGFLNNGLIPPQYLKPQVFFHTVVKKIMTEAGYEVRGKVLEDDRFLRHVIVFSKFPASFDFLDTINLASTLPDVLQSKIILDFLNIYGVMLDVDQDEMIITCDYIDDIIFNDYIDWGHKIDNSEFPEVKYDLGYAQKNYFKFKIDDVMTDAWEKEVLIDNETLDSEGPIYTSDFFNVNYYLNPSDITITSKPTGSLTGKGELPTVQVYEETRAWSVGQKVFHNGEYYIAIQLQNDLEDPKPPHLNGDYWTRMEESDVFTYKIKNMYGVVMLNPSSNVEILSSPSNIPVTRLITGDELDWEISYTRHYRMFDRIIKSTKVVEILMKLTQADINQLDFSRPYWFESYNGFFALEEVIQYNLSDPQSTMCRFIRI